MSEEKSFNLEFPLHVVLIEDSGFACLTTDAHTEENPEYAVALFPEEASAEAFIEQVGIDKAEVRTVHSMSDFVRFLKMFAKPHTHIAWNPQITGEHVKTDWIDSMENIIAQLPPISSDPEEKRPAPWRYPAFLVTDESGKNFVAISTVMPDKKPVKAVVMFSSSERAKKYRDESPLKGLKIQTIENHETMRGIFEKWRDQFNAVVIDPLITNQSEQSALCLWIDSLWEKYFQNSAETESPSDSNPR